MMERDQLVAKLRESVAPGKPDFGEVAEQCEQFLGFYRRSRAITQNDLQPVRVDMLDGVSVTIEDDDGEY